MRWKPVTVVVAAALVLGACGGSGLSAEEYYASAEAAAINYDDTTDEIFSRYTTVVQEALVEFQDRTADADTSILVEQTAILLEVTIAEITSAFDQAGTALGDFVAVMAELEPPSDVAEAHDATVAALQRSHDAIPELVTSLRGAGSLGDISELINGSTFGDTQPRLTSACRELQGLAADMGVTADLRCGDEDDEASD